MQTPTAGNLTRFYAGGYDLSSFLRGAKPSMSAKTEDFACFGDTWEKPFAVSESGSVTVEGFYENTDPVDSIDQKLNAGIGVNDQVITLVTEDVLGKVAYGLVTSGTAYDISGMGVASLVKVSAAFASRVALERLLVHHPKSAEVAPGSGGVIDNAAASAYGVAAYLQATSVLGGNLVVKLADSADNSTYADLITFSTVLANAFAAERKILAGTIRRYLRWTISGTFTSATFSLAAGRGTIGRLITQ